MTTTVVIKSPKPNYQDVQVQVVSEKGGNVYRTERLADGEEMQFYVYGGQALRVSEIRRVP